MTADNFIPTLIEGELEKIDNVVAQGSHQKRTGKNACEKVLECDEVVLGHSSSDSSRNVVGSFHFCVGVVYVARTLRTDTSVKYERRQVGTEDAYQLGLLPFPHSTFRYVMRDMNRSAWYLVNVS